MDALPSNRGAGYPGGMNATNLIDAIVRQTTVLIAQLATAAGVRAPLAHVANQVFLDLVAELRNQGVGGKVIADMFGMALRTYHARVQRLSESATDRGRTLWEVVLAYVQEHDVVQRTQVLHRFRHDDEALVRGVLNDLVESGMVFRSGRGERTVYRAAGPGEVPEGGDQVEADAALVLVAINRYQPATAEQISAALVLEGPRLAAALARLERDGRARQLEGAWRCDVCVIAMDSPVGWEAAVYDHYQAMVTAVCGKLRQGRTRARRSDAVGGSTYGFDVWPGHPLEEEVLGLLGELRGRLSDLRERVDAHNAQHPAPPTGANRALVYVGQTVLEDEDGMEEGR